MEQTTTTVASVDRNGRPVHASDWPIVYGDCIKLAWETEAQAEPMMYFAAGQLAGDHAFRNHNVDLVCDLLEVVADMFERAARLFVGSRVAIEDINIRLMALVDVATLKHDTKRLALLTTGGMTQKLLAAGRAADLLWGEACRLQRDGYDVPAFVPGDVVRAHLPWSRLPRRDAWERPAPFGRCTDGRPILVSPASADSYVRAATHLAIDPERLVAGFSAAVEAVAPHAVEGDHAAKAIERAREYARNAPTYPDPERAINTAACALARQVGCPCCDQEEAHGEERTRAWVQADYLAVPALREAWPEAAALVDEYRDDRTEATTEAQS